MTVRVLKSFDKDSDDITDKELHKRIADIIRHIQSAKTLSEIPNVKKMEGFRTFFRIRIGDYRIGFELVDGEIHLVRLLDRKDMYKKFPPH